MRFYCISYIFIYLTFVSLKVLLLFFHFLFLHIVLSLDQNINRSDVCSIIYVRSSLFTIYIFTKCHIRMCLAFSIF